MRERENKRIENGNGASAYEVRSNNETIVVYYPNGAVYVYNFLTGGNKVEHNWG